MVSVWLTFRPPYRSMIARDLPQLSTVVRVADVLGCEVQLRLIPRNDALPDWGGGHRRRKDGTYEPWSYYRRGLRKALPRRKQKMYDRHRPESVNTERSECHAG